MKWLNNFLISVVFLIVFSLVVVGLGWASYFLPLWAQLLTLTVPVGVCTYIFWNWKD